MSRMSEILGNRACRYHLDAPVPCSECAGIALSNGDRSRGGFKGTVSTFDDASDRSDVESKSDAAMRSSIDSWGVRKQLGNAAFN